MIDLTPEQATPRIASLLSHPESRTLEFKRMGENKVVRKLLEAICAFANTEGGVLALGVADEKHGKGAARLYGVQENPEALDELVRKVRTQYHPPIETIRFLGLPCTLRDRSAGQVVLVQVPQSDKVHTIVDDGTWTRLTSGNREMTTRRWQRLPTAAACAAPRASRCRWSGRCSIRRSGLNLPLLADSAGRSAAAGTDGAIGTGGKSRRGMGTAPGGGVPLCRRAGGSAGGARHTGRGAADDLPGESRGGRGQAEHEEAA